MRRPDPVTKDPKRELAAPKIRKGGGIPRYARELAAGAITARQYVESTQADYQALARRLETFWRLPRAIEREDIVQELYTQTFLHVRRWDPKLAPIGRFLTFNAMADTKKWLNVQRGARKGTDPSRCEELVDDLFAMEDGSPVDPGSLMPCAARQDGLALVHEMLAATGGEDDDGGTECLLALLYEDTEHEAALSVVSEGLAPTLPKANAMIERAKARAASVLAQ